MKILILSTRIPYPLTAGFRIRIYNTAKYLKNAGHSMGLLQISPNKQSNHYERELGEVFEMIETFQMNKTEAFWNLFKCLFNNDCPFQVALYKNRQFADKLASLTHQYDVVIANNVRAAEYAKSLSGIKKVLDLHDAVSYNYENAVKNTKGIKRFIYLTEYRRLKSYERDIVNYFDRNIIISKEDRAYLRKNGTNTDNIEVIPVAVRDDIKNCKTDYQHDKNAICFLGKMSYQPNEDAVLWFCQNVFPVLKEKITDLVFYIIGIEPTKKVLELGNIEDVVVTGFLENPFELVEQCKAMVVPIRNGAGMQNKILESMTVGTPTVISDIAAEGLNGIDGEHFLVAEKPEEYIEKVSMLVKNSILREKIGRAGQKLVKTEFSWNVLAEKWIRVIQGQEAMASDD